MAAIPASRTDPPKMVPRRPALLSDTFVKDTVLRWFRGEFAAANAIIDALCAHLAQVATSSDEYDAVFAAIHKRRLNWIPVIQMQKYYPIAEVAFELRMVAEKLTEPEGVGKTEIVDEKGEMEKEVTESDENGGDEAAAEVAEPEPEEYESPESEITDSGSQEMQPSLMNNNICSNHEECQGRASQIKLKKGFIAKESLKGHMVNVVKGLKLYEDIFTESEICKLTEFVNEIHAAGENGELSGDTFILFNKEMKGNKRELIQLGVPIFGQMQDDARSNIEPIPPLLNGVIDHLVQWQLIPEYKKPNGCIINFFEEGEFSQPFQKPPHLEQPLSTLLLSESTMAFGRILQSDNDGNYKGPLMLSLQKGSLLVMRGNSADMARHVMCPSPNRRVTITFFRLRPDSNQYQAPTPTMTTAMTLRQPGVASPYPLPNGALSGYEAMDMMPQWGLVSPPPMVMLTPMHPMAVNPRRPPRGGTGVFLPGKGQSRKHARHLPPRAQKGRLMELPSPSESNMGESSSEPSITVEE